MQRVAQEQGQLLDLRRRDHGFSHGETAGQTRNLIGKLVPAEPVERVNDQEIGGFVRLPDGMDHVLEDRPVLIERRRAGLGAICMTSTSCR